MTTEDEPCPTCGCPGEQYDGHVCEDFTALSTARKERDEARNLAKHLFMMIDQETWRSTGGDDGQGHYEGDYRAEQIHEQILGWETSK